jgi:hypothetical protein
MTCDVPVTPIMIYEGLKQLGTQLEVLHGSGRLRMTIDPLNTAWFDVESAVSTALAGLDAAVQAVAWMRVDQSYVNPASDR